MKVLLGIGGSEDSIRALEHEIERAENTGDELTIAILENPKSRIMPDEIEKKVNEVLEDAEIEVEIRRVSGDPGSRIVEIAENEGFDEIVLGGGQQSPMGKIKIGHIAEFVLFNSHVTVKLVR